MDKYFFVCTTVRTNEDYDSMTITPSVTTRVITASSEETAKMIGHAYCERKYPRNKGYHRPLVIGIMPLSDFLSNSNITIADISEWVELREEFKVV